MSETTTQIHAHVMPEPDPGVRHPRSASGSGAGRQTWAGSCVCNVLYYKPGVVSAAYEHPQVKLTGELALALFEAAAHSARLAAKQGRRLWPRKQRGRCLPPGDGTPLWNELLARARPHLKKRGRKAHLARLLGLPRQRLHDVLKARTACLDAERTLWLLCWIAAREQGRDLAA